MQPVPGRTAGGGRPALVTGVLLLVASLALLVPPLPGPPDARSILSSSFRSPVDVLVQGPGAAAAVAAVGGRPLAALPIVDGRPQLGGQELGRARLGGAELGGQELGGRRLDGQEPGVASLDGRHLGGQELGQEALSPAGAGRRMEPGRRPGPTTPAGPTDGDDTKGG